MKDLERYIDYLLQFYYQGENISKNPLKFEDIYEYENSLASRIYEIITLSRK